jgi:hypothetical protein
MSRVPLASLRRVGDAVYKSLRSRLARRNGDVSQSADDAGVVQGVQVTSRLLCDRALRAFRLMRRKTRVLQALENAVRRDTVRLDVAHGTSKALDALAECRVFQCVCFGRERRRERRVFEHADPRRSKSLVGGVKSSDERDCLTFEDLKACSVHENGKMI